MTELVVTFRNGKPLAAYLPLSKRSSDKAVHTEEAEAGLVVDFAADGRRIGIEITSPSQFNLAALNRVLISLNLTPADPADVTPLVAA